MLNSDGTTTTQVLIRQLLPPRQQQQQQQKHHAQVEAVNRQGLDTRVGNFLWKEIGKSKLTLLKTVSN